MNSPSLPLWQQLQACARVLAEVRAGRSLTEVLERLPAAVRPGAQALAFGALRRLGLAQALRQQLARRAPPPAVDALLCVALAWLVPEAQDAYDAHTLVNQTVEAAKRQPATQGQASFINACLRRCLRERDQLLQAVAAHPEARWNHPRWWIERLQQDHPQDWQTLLAANQQPAPLVLRVNTRRTSVAAYLHALTQAGLSAEPLGRSGIRLHQARPVPALPGFQDGWFSVQDAGAQLAAPLLLDGLRRPLDRPLRILDACAAPGGKTAHLLELVDAEVTALDIDPLRCQRITDTLSRLHLHATVQAADAARPELWWDGRPFDAILLDAPCTASGIVRRHPDVRWLRRASDVAQLATVQARLLDQLWPLLAPGGRLLYCTCSVFRAEGSAQVQAFLARNTQARQSSAPGHLIPSKATQGDGLLDNLAGEYDGFFYALLDKA